MINLIPPKRLINMRIARSNTVLRRYIELLLMSAALVVLALVVSYYFLNHRQKNVQATLDIEQKKAQQLEPVQKDAQQLSATINMIAGLQSRNVKFSQMLTTIGGAMPNGTVLTGLQFSLENVDAPFVISAEVENESLAAVLRNNLLAVGLFKTVTIKNITLLEKVEDTSQQPTQSTDTQAETTEQPASQPKPPASPYRYTTTIDTYFKDMGVVQ
jgi:Tfp pilus assembly protein PilN